MKPLIDLLIVLTLMKQEVNYYEHNIYIHVVLLIVWWSYHLTHVQYQFSSFVL